MDVLDEVEAGNACTCVYINPPMDGQCSDEDSGDDENVCVDNLPRSILKQPAVTIENDETGYTERPS